MEMKAEDAKINYRKEAKKLYDEIFKIRLKNSFSPDIDDSENFKDKEKKLHECIVLSIDEDKLRNKYQLIQSEGRPMYRGVLMDHKIDVKKGNYLFLLSDSSQIKEWVKYNIENLGIISNNDTNIDELNVLHLNALLQKELYFELLSCAIKENKEEFIKVLTNPNANTFKLWSPSGYVEQDLKAYCAYKFIQSLLDEYNI